MCCRYLQQYALCVCSFVWALVHSPDPAHVQRGLDLAQSMIKARDIDQQHLNDLVYMCAVVGLHLEFTCVYVQMLDFLTLCLLCTGSVSQRELPSCQSPDC